jgi:hypothetical protein
VRAVVPTVARRTARVLPLFGVLAGLALPAQAHFEHLLLSARSAALGGAFVAVANDPSASIANPAGLSGLRALGLVATYQRPYGVDGLDEGSLVAAVPVRGFGLGASWFHRGLSGALSEDLLTLSVAHDLKRTSEDASLSIGASVDLAHVAAHGEIDDAASAVGAGAGVLLRPFAFIGLGYAVRDLNAPRVDLVQGGGDTRLRTRQTVAFAYYWHERMVVTVEDYQDSGGTWRRRAGLELNASTHVALRAGLESSHATAGFGVEWNGIRFDGAMRADADLGASYIMTLGYARGEEATPYGSAR